MHGYRLAPGDRLTVTVAGEAELSGNFTIDETGNIQLPLVGSLSVSRITIEECRQRLIERLADGYLKKPEVSVRISEFRPIYVLGDVRTPGSYPFRAGLTGLTAIALAGGIGSADVGQSAAGAELIAAQERVMVLEWTRLRLVVRLARIEAERAGKSTFEVPGISDVFGIADVSSLIQREREQLSAGLKAHEQSLDLLERQKPRVQAEIEATQEQIASEKRQLELSQARVIEYNRLAKLGLSQSFRETELQSQAAQREGNISRLNAERARLDVALGDLDIRIHEVENARQTRILNELRETTNQLKEIELSLPLSRRLLLRRQQATLVSEGERTKMSYQIFLIRGEAGRLKSVQSNEQVALEPGDILEVRRTELSVGRGTTPEPCDHEGRLSCLSSGAAPSIQSSR